MPFLLDTMAISEFRKPLPNAGFLGWASANEGEETFLASPTLGELVQGAFQARPAERRRVLASWIAQTEERFAERIIPFGIEAARVWGEANSVARRSGRRLSPIDSQLAAIAVVHGLTIVTRNVRDFKIPEFKALRVVNPWS
ncbi:MAG: type II toxin-antitoxin system VapC family toxin [Candidatus Tyrphobacter sp.]